MTKPASPFAISLLWTFIGAVALVVMTVGITVSVASLHTADRTSELLTQLHRANGQIDDLRTTYAAQQAQVDAERTRSDAERAQLRRQNRITRAQLAAVLAYLRDHGIDIPPAIVKPSAAGGGGSPPKATGPRGPNPSTTPPAPSSHPRPSPSPSPRPTSGTTGTTTGPTTATAITDLLCLLLPFC